MNMVYAVPLIVVAAGAALGVGLVRRGRWRWFWGIVVAVAALFVWAWAAAQGKDNGWDALALFIPVVMLLAPVALGMLIGGALVRLGLFRG